MRRTTTLMSGEHSPSDCLHSQHSDSCDNDRIPESDYTAVKELAGSNDYVSNAIPCQRHGIINTDRSHVRDSIATNTGTRQIIVQPILAYILYALQNATLEHVCAAVVGHFTAADIAEAKQELWEKCGGQVIGTEMPRRRDSTVRSIDEAHTQDMISALNKLDNADQLPIVMLDAYSIGTLPRWNPEEMNSVSLADRMLQLEQKLTTLQQTVDRNTAMGIATKERLDTSPLYSMAVTKNAMNQQMPTPASVDLTSSAQRPQAVNQNTGAPPRPRKVVATSVTDERGNSNKRTAEVNRSHTTVRLTAQRDEASGNGTDDDDFQRPAQVVRKEKKREYRRQRFITGIKAHTNGRFKGAPEAGRDIFIFRVHPDTDTNDVHELIATEGYEIRRLDCVSNPEAKYKSFRLTVPASQYAKLYSDDFPWPEGVRVRRYIPPYRTKNNGTQPESQQSVN